MKASLVVNHTKLLELDKAYKENNFECSKKKKKRANDSEDSLDVEPDILESKMEVSFSHLQI